MKKVFLFVSFLSAIFFNNVLSQEFLDLKDFLQLGLERNYQIRIVRNQEKIADNNVTIGNAGYLPQLDLNGGYSGTVNNTQQNYHSGDRIKNNGVHDQTLNAGLNLAWTVFDGFSIQANYDRLKELRNRGELNTRLTIENFIAQLTGEYYNYVQQNIRLNNLQYAVKLSKERLRIVEARYSIGSLSRLDLQQARVDFNADSSKLMKQYEVLHVSRTSLLEMIAADDIEAPVLLADTIIEYDPLLQRDELWQRTMSGNTLLLLSQKERKLSQLDLKTVESQYYPYVRLNAGYGYTKNIYDKRDIDRQNNWGFNYGITIGFNIFDGFNRKRQQRNAKIEIQNRELEYQQLVLSLETELSNMWMAYQNNIMITNLERENLSTAKDYYDAAIDRYKLGDLSGIELREAQNSLLEAEERLVQALYNTKLYEISLSQISGQVVRYLE